MNYKKYKTMLEICSYIVVVMIVIFGIFSGIEIPSPFPIIREEVIITFKLDIWMTLLLIVLIIGILLMVCYQCVLHKENKYICEKGGIYSE